MAETGSDLTEKQQRVKERFIETRGFWSELYDAWLRLDAESFDRLRELASYPWENGVLDPKVKEFVYIAIDCNTTHLYNKGTRVHIQNAFDAGATVEELMEVFQLASVIGVHTMSEAIPLLVEAAGRPDEPTDEDHEPREELKRAFEDRHGYWSELWEDFLELDPGYFKAFMRYSAHPWENGVLDPKVKEFVYIAIDCSTTRLYNRGTRVHIQNALDHGATREEIMEVFELASILGVHAMTDSVPILVEEAKNYGELPEEF